MLSNRSPGDFSQSPFQRGYQTIEFVPCREVSVIYGQETAQLTVGEFKLAPSEVSRVFIEEEVEIRFDVQEEKISSFDLKDNAREIKMFLKSRKKRMSCEVITVDNSQFF